MSTREKKKRSGLGAPQIKKIFHVLDTSLRLVKRIFGAGEETSPSEDLYDRWRSLSPLERQLIYLTCMGFKDQRIAFHMRLTTDSVKYLLRKVCLKMGVRTKAELHLKFANFDFTKSPP